MKISIKNRAKLELEALSKNTMLTALDITIDEVGDDFIVGSMPVTWKVVQPARILHGGASVALAESLGSIASYFLIDPKTQYCVGLEINANHIRGVKENEGRVIGKATPIHIGRKTHVWDIKITNEQGQLVCISRLTVAILEKTA
jgi:1,4-dihydroxy-2-naphthoyl-CoA hydrolase